MIDVPIITEIQKIKNIILRDPECDRNPLKYHPHSKRYQLSFSLYYSYIPHLRILIYCIQKCADCILNHLLNAKPAINLLIPVERLRFITDKLFTQSSFGKDYFDELILIVDTSCIR